MKRSKFEIAFEVVAWLAVIISLIFIIGFIFIIVSLFRYDECRQQEFVPVYCENYKNY